jgi:sacsin
MYGCVSSLPVLHSAQSNSWVAPRDAVLPDHTPAASATLLAALLAERLPLAASTPAAVCDGFASADVPGLRFLAPTLVRELMRAPGEHPSLGSRPHVLALLDYCLSDTLDDDPASTRALAGVPLLPLAQGALARFAVRTPSAPLFNITTPLEAELLASLHSILVDATLPEALHGRLAALAAGGSLNLRCVSADVLASLLPDLLPREWAGKTEVPWAPGVGDHVPAAFLKLLWRRLQTEPSLEPFASWPLLPTATPGMGIASLLLVAARPGCGVVLHDGFSENLAAALHAAGCRLQAPEFPEVAHPRLRSYVHEATCCGILDAIAAAVSGRAPDGSSNEVHLAAALRARMASASDAERSELRSFLLQSRWHGAKSLAPAQLAVLRALPIYETFGTRAETRFVAACSGALSLPPAGAAIDPALLDERILRAGSAREAEVLAAILGVSPAPRAAFFRAQAVGRLADFTPSTRDAIFAALLRDLPALTAEDASFAEALAACAFVPVAPAAGALTPEPRRASRLYDPRVAVVKSLLDGCALFPAPPFNTPDTLDALVALGLRRSLGAQGVLDAARAVQTAAAADAAAGAERGSSLLRFLCSISVDAAAEGAPDADAFWTTLASIPWCPVLAEAPSALLPWPSSNGALAKLAPPRACRPVADAWLVSSCCRLVDADAVPPPLAARLGWAATPPASVLSAQLLELSKSYAAAAAAASVEFDRPRAADDDADVAAPHHTPAVDAARALHAALEAAAPQLYAGLASLSKESDVEIMRAMLDGAPSVWTGDGFVLASSVAFDAPPTYAPYINALPQYALPHRALLLALGAREALSSDDFCAALAALASEHTDQPLPAELLPLAAEFAERAVEALPPGAPPPSVCLPDVAGYLTPAADLLFNDAAWLAGCAAFCALHALVNPSHADCCMCVQRQR